MFIVKQKIWKEGRKEKKGMKEERKEGIEWKKVGRKWKKDGEGTAQCVGHLASIFKPLYLHSSLQE